MKQYQTEYNNPNTSPARKAAIDAQWHFSTNGSNYGTPKGVTSNTPFGSPTPNLSTPEGIAQAQYNANASTARESATLNSGGITGDTGSSNLVRNADGTYSVSNKLNGSLQQGADQAQQGIANGGNLNYGNSPGMPKQPDYSNMPSIPQGGQFQDFANNTANGIFQNAKGRLDPVFKQQNEEFEQQMADQGIPQGSAKYNYLRQQQSQNQNDAYNNAQSQAQQAGISQENNLYGQSLQSRQQGVGEQTGLFGLGMQARQQGNTEAQTLHNSNYSDAANIHGLNPNQTPLYQSNVAATDVNSPANNAVNNTGATTRQGMADAASIQSAQLAQAGANGRQGADIASREKVAQAQIAATQATNSQAGTNGIVSGVSSIASALGPPIINSYKTPAS